MQSEGENERGHFCEIVSNGNLAWTCRVFFCSQYILAKLSSTHTHTQWSMTRLDWMEYLRYSIVSDFIRIVFATKRSIAMPCVDLCVFYMCVYSENGFIHRGYNAYTYSNWLQSYIKLKKGHRHSTSSSSQNKIDTCIHIFIRVKWMWIGLAGAR